MLCDLTDKGGEGSVIMAGAACRLVRVGEEGREAEGSKAGAQAGALNSPRQVGK